MVNIFGTNDRQMVNKLYISEMNKLEFTEIPNTGGKYGMNKDKLIIDFNRSTYIIPFGDGKRVKVVYEGKRTSKGIQQLFDLTFGLETRDNPEHPIIHELRVLEAKAMKLMHEIKEVREKFQ